jgi:glycosyltransferase involved in cell wall biosynthesis
MQHFDVGINIERHPEMGGAEMLGTDGTEFHFNRHRFAAIEAIEEPVQEEKELDLSRVYPNQKLDGYPRISVIIPAFNEEVAIGSVVLGAKQFSDQVIVIDDGSTDRTARMAELAGAKVISLEKNSGKAHALMYGLKLPENDDCDVIVVMDGDGQHRSEDIISVIAPVLEREADLVIGSRYMGEGNDVPRYRQLGQGILNHLTNISSEVKISDSQSGLRALSFKAIENLDFASENYNIESDMIIHFANRGLTIKEVPISVRYDVPHGHKKNSITMGMGLFGNVVSTIGYKRPLIVFGIPGLILMLVGLGMGFFTMLEIHLFGTWAIQLLTSVSIGLIGSAMCVSALILNSLVLLMKANKKSTES